MVAWNRGVADLWSWREESNLQPVVYKTTALPIELRQRQWQSTRPKFLLQVFMPLLDVYSGIGYSPRAPLLNRRMYDTVAMDSPGSSAGDGVRERRMGASEQTERRLYYGLQQMSERGDAGPEKSAGKQLLCAPGH